MIVPKKIINKMHQLARLSAKAGELSLEIDEYFINQGYNIEELRDGDGCSLEELEYGNDVTEKFLTRLEEE